MTTTMGRKTSSAWIRIALAAVALTSVAAAQAQDDQKGKREEQRKAAPPRGDQRGPGRGAEQRQAPPQRPAEARPAEARPVEARPAETRPAEARPAEARPQMSRPAENRPAVDRPRDDRPSENQNRDRRDFPRGNPNQGRPPVVNNQAPPVVQPPAARPGDRNNNNPGVGRPNVNTNDPSQGRQFGRGAPNNRPGDNTPGNNLGSRDNRPGGRDGRSPSVYRGPNNTEVRYRSNGQPSVVRTRDMTISHTSYGSRRVVVQRPDRVIVTNSAGHGYVQRNFEARNVRYVQRTYYVRGTPFTRVYRPYSYRGISLNIYAPRRYYAPAFYMWAWDPWPSPVIYNWGWTGRPWYGYYGGYFSPYARYSSAALWLTDYVIATSLERAYEERMDAQAAANAAAYQDSAPLTPDVKQAIADEVRRQLEDERNEGQQMSQDANYGPPSYLTDNASHVFVVGASLDLMSRDGECSVSEGDVLQMRNAPPAGSNSAEVVVLASKSGCRRGETVTVSLVDLQDMQNHMRETLDQGLGELQSREGQGGLPMPPAAAQRPGVDAPYASAAPPADTDVASELSQEARAAAQAENDVLSQARAAGDAPVVSLGMTVDQVLGEYGRPDRVADLGSRKIYYFGNTKVTFTDGRVTDIQ